MDFSVIQSLGNYTRNMEMQLKWQKKKADNDFTADGSTKLTDPTARQAEEIRKAQADGSAKFSSQIRTKLAAGKKLTQEEMEYLEKHDPQTYLKVKAIEAEKKSYEKELKSCKTKEEVQQVRTNRVAASLSVVNNVKNNPAIPEGAKLGILWQELQKNMAMEEAVRKLVEAEKQKVEKELQELKEVELGSEDFREREEEQEPIEGADKKEAAFHEDIERDRVVLQERKKTRAQVEATPEAMKVKRARAQAAYKGSQVEIPSSMIDVKAEPCPSLPGSR